MGIFARSQTAEALHQKEEAERQRIVALRQTDEAERQKAEAEKPDPADASGSGRSHGRQVRRGKRVLPIRESRFGRSRSERGLADANLRQICSLACRLQSAPGQMPICCSVNSDFFIGQSSLGILAGNLSFKLV
jgi:hypothetical protein